jgi:hypothetical protein
LDKIQIILHNYNRGSLRQIRQALLENIDVILQSIRTQLKIGILSAAHILSEGSKRPRKSIRKSSTFFVSAYWSPFVAASSKAPKT